MSEKEREIMRTFSEVVPKLTEIQQEKLLSFGEGMAFMKRREEAEAEYKRRAQTA